VKGRVVQRQEEFTVPDHIKALKGDGAAEVSVALSYADKDYGNGFEARVQVTLRCAQTTEALDAVNQLALERAAAYLGDAKDVAEAIYNELRDASQNRTI
jgi:hypothetical protein